MATLAMFFRRPLAAPVTGGAVHHPSVPVDDRFWLRALPNEDVFLYSKRIDNSRVVRQTNKAGQGEWSAIAVAALLSLLLMGALTPRVANVFAGYQLESLKQEQKRLLDEQRELVIIEARIWRQENLEVQAKQRELSTPAPGQIVHLDPRGDSKLAMNRR
ncbi:MAG TPA: hypothetical protein VKR61_25330 [Bryobacteraceae bacterium]|nr:hypothetical protein [Bryobacteraceae bacterium]